jgi:hypothetical protein
MLQDKKAKGINPYPHKFQVLCWLQGPFITVSSTTCTSRHLLMGSCAQQAAQGQLVRCGFMKATADIDSVSSLLVVQVSMSIPEYVDKYHGLEAGAQQTEVAVSLAGA